MCTKNHVSVPEKSTWIDQIVLFLVHSNKKLFMCKYTCFYAISCTQVLGAYYKVCLLIVPRPHPSRSTPVCLRPNHWTDRYSDRIGQSLAGDGATGSQRGDQMTWKFTYWINKALRKNLERGTLDHCFVGRLSSCQRPWWSVLGNTACTILEKYSLLDVPRCALENGILYI